LIIGVPTAVDLCGAVRLHIDGIEGTDRGALKVNGDLTNEELGARGL
jgi:hypothetical protein